MCVCVLCVVCVCCWCFWVLVEYSIREIERAKKRGRKLPNRSIHEPIMRVRKRRDGSP